jgi:RNA polymerase sigma factor (TIGR02999 family)
MSDITRILSQIESGDPAAAGELLPLVYDELRKLAAAKLAQEKPGQTLQATALVHEAYVRLLGSDPSQPWDSRGHFFAAAAEAMRRILIDGARRKRSLKRGGEVGQVEFTDELLATTVRGFDLVELDDALTELERHDATAAQLVKLRYFAGFGHREAAEALGINRREADRLWALARAWLYQQLGDTNA